MSLLDYSGPLGVAVLTGVTVVSRNFVSPDSSIYMPVLRSSCLCFIANLISCIERI